MHNMQGMMQQVKKMQKDMEKAQKKLEAEVFTVSDNQNLVQVKITGKRELVDLAIDPALIDPEDPMMLQDVLLATINQANAKVDQATNDRLGKFTQGLNLPF